MRALIFFIAITILVILGIYKIIYLNQEKQNNVFYKQQTIEKKIRVGNIGEYSIFNIIAKEKGYFKKNGLDATIYEYGSGLHSVEALLDGRVDVAIAAEFVGVNKIFLHKNLRIISQVSRHKVFHLVARKDREISSPPDIRGKKIGVTRKSAGEFYLGQFLATHNLTLKDVDVIDLPPSELITYIENGRVDAIVIFDPHAYNIQKKLGNSIIMWSAQGDQDTYALVYSTDSFIKAHPEIILRFLRSTVQAEIYTQKYPIESQKLISKILGYDNLYIRYIWLNFVFVHELGQELLLRMESQARWVIQNGLTPERTVPNYLNFIYFDGLKMTKPEAITAVY